MKNENQIKNKKTLQYWMRALHKDIGFFIIGLTVIYAISGIVLVYRDTDVFKQETFISKKVKPQASPEDLQRMLHVKELKVLNTDGDMVSFQIGQYNDGKYNKATGEISYTTKDNPRWVAGMIDLHMQASQGIKHFISVIFAVLLLFLAISSFWMFKSGSKQLRRGIYFAVGGVLFSIIIIMI